MAAPTRHSAVGALSAAVRDRILEGGFEPGQRLVERELVEGYGVSRVTVRSALSQLAAEGLVVIEPNRGARVASLDDAALRDLFDLRIALETEATRIALARRPLAAVAEVAEAVDELSRLCRARRPNWPRITAAHGNVHATLVASARSPRIAEAHRALSAELSLFMMRLRPRWSAARMAEHHEKLLRELPKQGEAAIRRHLEEGEAAVLSSPLLRSA